MLRIIYFILFLCVSLVSLLPALWKIKRIPKQMNTETHDRQVHEIPKKWAQQVIRVTGSAVHISGQENIPEGPVLLVSNHEGDFDVPALLGFIEKPFGFISKVQMKKVPMIRDWMEVLNCVYINRENRRDAVKMLRDGTDMLKKGHSLLIFPEGTRSLGGSLKPFKSGSFRMAKEANVPIVPIAIKGSAEIFENNNRKKITPGTIEIAVLPAIPVSDFINRDTKEVAELAQHAIQEALA